MTKVRNNFRFTFYDFSFFSNMEKIEIRVNVRPEGATLLDQGCNGVCCPKL